MAIDRRTMTVLGLPRGCRSRPRGAPPPHLACKAPRGPIRADLVGDVVEPPSISDHEGPHGQRQRGRDAEWGSDARSQVRVACGSARVRRAMWFASTCATLCVPAMKRTDGPMLAAVGAPAKYKFGTDDSPTLLTTG